MVTNNDNGFGEFVIRNLRHDDLNDLLLLYHHLHAQDDPVPDAIGEIWADIVTDPTHIYLAGFVAGVLVSACNAVIIPNLTRGARPYALIENVVTHEDFRRRGIASRVLRALVEQCLDRGCYKVMLMSGMHRKEIHGLYETVGFDGDAKKAFVISAR